MLSKLVVVLAGAVFAQAGKPKPAVQFLKPNVDYAALAANVHTVKVLTKESSLPADARPVVQKLLELKPWVDAVYRRQRSQELGDEIMAAMRASADPRAKSALKLLELHSGPYDQWNSNASDFNVPPYPKEGFYYPQGLTKAEFDAYVAAHPEQKPALYSPYTLITRTKAGALAATPYHEAYREQVERIAKILSEAAALSKNASLKAFLESKAQGLPKDDYAESYGKWIAMKDAPIDLVVGPAESYEDGLTGVKENYTFALYARDERGSDVLNQFLAKSGEIGRELPLADEFNPYKKSAGYTPARNMEAVNLMALGGESLTFTAAGWTLPNEPEITARFGTKMLLIRNVIATRGFEAMDFLQKRLFGESYDPESFYWLVAGHELSHGMLPLTVGFDPKGKPLNEAMGTLAGPIEEMKADLLGMVALERLWKDKVISESVYWSVARTIVGSDNVFSLFRDPEEAHAKYKLVVYNLLKEKGAVTFDQKTGRMAVQKNFPQAMREITGLFLTVEAKGDKALAEKLLADYNKPAAELTAAIEAVKNAKIPSRTFYDGAVEKN